MLTRWSMDVSLGMINDFETLKLISLLGLSNWLINAFNGEWLKTANARPVGNKKKRSLIEEESIY